MYVYLENKWVPTAGLPELPLLPSGLLTLVLPKNPEEILARTVRWDLGGGVLRLVLR